MVIVLAITLGLTANAQTSSSGSLSPNDPGLKGIRNSDLHFDVTHSNVTDSGYAAMQDRARRAMVEKNHAGLILGARNGTAGQWVAIKTAWAERDPSILSHYAGRWFLYLALAVIALRILFR